MTPQKVDTQNRVEGIGCSWALVGLNGVLMGMFAVSFVRGPFSSSGQEFWYRYGSLAFFAGGVVLPAIILFAARRSRLAVIAVTVWMLTVLLAFAWFATNSGGGV